MKYSRAAAHTALVVTAMLVGGAIFIKNRSSSLWAPHHPLPTEQANQQPPPSESLPGAEESKKDTAAVGSPARSSQNAPAIRTNPKEGAPQPMFKVVGVTTGKPLDAKLFPHHARVAGSKEAADGRVTLVDRASFAMVQHLQQGDRVNLPLSDSASVEGTVNLVLKQANGLTSIGGALANDAGEFGIDVHGAHIVGLIRLPQQGLAYRIETSNKGEVAVREALLGEVVCMQTASRLSSQMLGAASFVAATGAVAATSVPVLESRPTAGFVIYLDFDGETVTDPLWNGGATINAAPSGLSSDQITDIFNRVKEDYAPFDVNVTTNRAKYDGNTAKKRLMCVVTPTNTAAIDPQTGVAPINITGYAIAGCLADNDRTVPCWAFTHLLAGYGPGGVADSISHEIGHTLGLGHHGRSNPVEAYFAGHGLGSFSINNVRSLLWGPIMGAPVKFLPNSSYPSGFQAVSADVTQWSKGEYAFAQLQLPQTDWDDFSVITRAANGVKFVPDEAEGSVAQAMPLSISGTTINQVGIISSAADTDCFSFKSNGGLITISADNPNPNLDVLLELTDSSGAVLASSNRADSMSATLTYAVGAGNYFVRVSGTGAGNPSTDGYSSYGSVGAYTLSGSGPFTANAPTVSELSITNISANGVTLAGTVNSDNGAPITERGIVYSVTSESANPVIGGASVGRITAAGTTGLFAVTLGSLAHATNYSFRAYAINSLGTTYSPVANFITDPIPPIVDNPTVTNVTGTGAILGGTVLSDGGDLIQYRGVVCSVTSVNSDPKITDFNAVPLSINGTTGVFAVSVIGLTQGTSYTFKAFAINSKGISYTAARSFTTPVAPTVTQPSIDTASAYTGTVGGVVQSDNGSPIIERGAVCSLATVNQNPLIGGTGVTKVSTTGTTGGFSVVVGSLTPNTLYAFRIYAVNLGGTGYSAVSYFLTTSAAPFVSTGAAYPLATGATIGGIVNAQDFATSSVSFSWGTTASYGQTVSATPSTVVGSSNTTVTADLIGLSRHTTYHYRLNATNSNGTTNGTDRTFTTANEVPVAKGQGGISMPRNTPAQIILTASDSDGDSLIYTVASQPGFGSAVISGNIATYTPIAGYDGVDSFTFTASDSYGGTSSPATIGLSVGSKNTSPLLAVNPAGTSSLSGVTSFTGVDGLSPGGYPMGGLIQGRDGNFYGTTQLGGATNLGTVFRVTPAGVFTTLVTFTGTGGANPGASPRGGLIQGRDGAFYGMTCEGGTSGLGTVFKMTLLGTRTTLINFTGTTGGNMGAKPYGRLVEGGDGLFYGMTSGGGTADVGTVFKMTSSGVQTTLASFPATIGQGPEGDLIEGSDGNFYGLTPGGGTAGAGTAFKITRAGVLTTVANFDGSTLVHPQGSLVQDSGGTFYGVTLLGSGYGYGAVFSMTAAGVTTRLVSFTGTGGANPGSNPPFGLVQGTDGNFYGVTTRGGASDVGTIFKVTSSGQLTTLYDLGGVQYFNGSLLQGSDGAFYGLAATQPFGHLFRFGTQSVGATAAEGVVATNAGTFSDAEGNATVTLTANVGTVTKNNAAGTWSWSATGLDGPSVTPVTITAVDDNGNVASAAFTATATNVAPTLSISGPANARAGVPVSFTVSATDPSPADQAAGFHWRIDFNDGTGQDFPAGTVSPLTITHTFATAGSFYIPVDAEDKDGALGSAHTSINILSNHPPVVRVGEGAAYSFANTASLATERYKHTASVLTNGKVLVVGGSYNGSDTLASAEIYDPANGTWAPAGNLTSKRFEHTASLLSNGKVLVIGGDSGSVESYDPSTNAWTPLYSVAYGRRRHTATVLNNGKILITGGWNGNTLAAVDLYDPSANMVTSASLDTARSQHTATLLSSGKVLVVGGYNQSAGDAISSAEIYDPATNLWSSAGNLASARQNHTAVLLGSGKVLIAGGERLGTPLGSAELYDPTTNTWASAGNLVSARTSHTATVMSSGKVMVISGLGASGWVGSVELYDPMTNTWEITGSLTQARFFHTASLLENGSVLIAGGANWSDGLYLKSTELAAPVSVVASGTEQVPATQGGTFSDPDGNATTKLSASRGTVVQDNAAGTWFWNAADTDGPANFEVVITATDDTGATASAPFTFTVINLPPAVGIAAPATANAKVPVNFSFSASDPSTQDQLAGFAWSIDYGDGTGAQSIASGTQSPLLLVHSFANGGTFVVRMTATDKNGGVSVQVSKMIAIATQTAAQSWAQAHGVSADLSLPGANGQANLLNFAFGMSPSATTNSPLSYTGNFSTVGTVVPIGEPIVGTQGSGAAETHWALFVRRVDYVAAGLSYTARFSNDLVSWQDSLAVPTVLADDGVNQLVGVPYPALLSNGLAPKFFQVSVSILP